MGLFSPLFVCSDKSQDTKAGLGWGQVKAQKTKLSFKAERFRGPQGRSGNHIMKSLFGILAKEKILLRRESKHRAGGSRDSLKYPVGRGIIYFLFIIFYVLFIIFYLFFLFYFYYFKFISFIILFILFLYSFSLLFLFIIFLYLF